MWLLTADAIDDFDHMAIWGARTFGYHQSERYERRIVGMLDTLAGNPQMASERQASARRVRLMPCKAHHILYVIQDEDIVILRVLHHLQDWFEML